MKSPTQECLLDGNQFHFGMYVFCHKGNFTWTLAFSNLGPPGYKSHPAAKLYIQTDQHTDGLIPVYFPKTLVLRVIIMASFGIYIQCMLLTLCQTSPSFYVFAVHIFWKHCGKRSNFSFSHCVFSPFGELSSIFIKSESVVCNLF